MKRSTFLALALLIALAIVCGVMVQRDLKKSKVASETFSELSEIVRPEESPSQDRKDEAEKDVVPTPVAVKDFLSLAESNEDCIAWLTITGTCVDYPVMHTPSAPEKYLHLNFYGQYSDYGVPFLDGHNTMEDDNLVIFGHNMNDGSMFGSLKFFLKRSYLETYPYIDVTTADGQRCYEIFAVALANKTDDWYSFHRSIDADDYDYAVDCILKKAQLTRGERPDYPSQILTLSTCHGSSRDGRLLILAKEVDLCP